MLHVQVITPEKIIFDDQAQEVIATTANGQITILPNHIPLVTQLVPGELIIRKNNKEDNIVVVGGFLELGKDTVTILADYATHGKDISEAKAKEAKQRAEKLMKEKLTEHDFRIAEAELQKALLELKVAGRHRKVT